MYQMARMTFYRKYRSQTFEEMEGQTHIIQTLSNAISNKRLAHAYIFSGPRGTGKTSAARIFAKAVNTFETEGQFSNLDNDLCNRITSGVCVDIAEIDAASNTGVDNIRDLNDKVNFTPIECVYKFYIIDEVHMLSTGAFNALLKTLEEPPAHTIFVLATTEPHKIPITIHSRCQHLRFRNLSDAEIISRLKYVCEKETISLSDNACGIIAQNSSGCMRDALSLLDQIYSFKGTSIKDDDVVSVLGACSIDLTNQIVKALIEKQSGLLVSLLNSTFKSGINPLQLLKDLVFTVENVLSYKSGAKELVKYNIQFVESVMSLVDIHTIVGLLDCLVTIESETRWFSNPALLMQIKLVQFILADSSLNQVGASGKFNSSGQVNSEAKVVQSTQSLQPVSELKVFSPAKAASINLVSQSNPSARGFNKTSNQANNLNTAKTAPSKSSGSFSIPTMPVEQVNTDVPAEVVSNNISVVSEDFTFELCQSKWAGFLIKLKSMHTGLFTILRQSQVMNLDKHCLEIKLFQPVQFFVDKLTEQTYKGLLETFLFEFYGSKLMFKVYDISVGSTENVVDQLSGDISSINLDSPASTQPVQSASKKSQDELSLNQIISLFEGKVL
jgi:DNA polymerase III subunit gamma/tau